jgi:type II secretory pathway pseudopilin PulG
MIMSFEGYQEARVTEAEEDRLNAVQSQLDSMQKDGGRIAINPDKFDKLVTALRTAVDNDGTLDKEATSYNDIFDAFRLALKFYHFQE